MVQIYTNKKMLYCRHSLILIEFEELRPRPLAIVGARVGLEGWNFLPCYEVQS